MGEGKSFFSPSKLLVMGLPIVWLLGWILQLVALLGPSNGVFINVYLFGIKSASLFSDPWPGYGGLNYVGASQLNYGYNASADQIARFVTTTYTTTYGIETGTQTIVTTAAVTTVATTYAPGATGAGAGAGSGSGSDSGSGSGSGSGTGSSGTGTGSSGTGSNGGSGSGGTGSGSGGGGSADPNQNTSQNDPNIDDNGPVALYVGPYSYAYRLQPDGDLVKIHGGLVSLDSVSPTSPLTYAAWAWSSKEVQSLLTFRLSVIPILCSVSIAFGILATGLLFYGLLLSMQADFDPDSSDGYKMIKPALWIGSIAILLLLILIYYSSFVLGEQCQSLNIAFLNAGIAYRCYQGDAPIFWRITFIIYICVSIIYITQLVNFNPTKPKPKTEAEKKADAKKKAEEAAIKEQDEFNEVWRRFIRWGAVRVPLAFLGISEPGPTVERKKDGK